MELFVDLLEHGVALAVQPASLAFITLGVIIGIVSGLLPGVTPITPMGVLLPFTFGMKPEHAILLFVSILVGSQFGNGIPSVLIRTPGTPSALMTALEGYEFQKRGEGGKAIGLALIASTVGQFLSFIAVVLLLVPLAEIAVYFLFPEMFALSILALTTAASLGGRNVAKGFVAAAFGVALTTIGRDPVTARVRFSFGNLYLEQGLDTMAMLLGILVVGEILFASRQSYAWPKTSARIGRIFPPWQELRSLDRAMLVGTVMGFFLGILPGAGPAAAALVGYQQSKLFARRPEQFGKGSDEGLAAAEAANNAAVAGDLVPTLVFGIPGGPAMVLVMAALAIHGITPGPSLFQSAPVALHATVGGLLMATIITFGVGYLMIRPSVYVLSLSRTAVFLGAFIFCIVGVYSVRSSFFDVYVLLLLGLVSYVMRRYGYPVAPAALGVVLGDLLEDNLRRGLVMEFGNFAAFFSRPAVVIILALALATLLYPYLVAYLRGRSQAPGVMRET